MKTTEVLTHFKVSNPSEITWSHATNTQEKLDNALNSSKHFLEVDVRYDQQTHQPYLGHDLGSPVEVTIQTFLEKLRDTGKGIKLDFKEIKAVEPTLCLVSSLHSELGPLIINADVLPGPGAAKLGLPFNEFLTQTAKHTPDAILSVGWITQVIENLTYTDAHVTSMLEMLEALSWASDVTFAIRAHYIAQSWKQLEKLLEQSNHTLTIWNNEKVPDGLRYWIEKHVSAAKAFVDLYDVETQEPLTVSLH